MKLTITRYPWVKQTPYMVLEADTYEIVGRFETEAEARAAAVAYLAGPELVAEFDSASLGAPGEVHGNQAKGHGDV